MIVNKKKDIFLNLYYSQILNNNIKRRDIKYLFFNLYKLKKDKNEKVLV